MNLETFALERVDAPSRLMQLARETPDKCLDVTALDRPMAVTQENRMELPPLDDAARVRLENLGWSPQVLDAIGSQAEANIYEGANLESAQINGKEVLMRTDIDYAQTDGLNQTNLERMKRGLAPVTAEGQKIELHHIGQKPDSPLAELTHAEHCGNGNDNVLHNKLKESEIVREDFDKERQEHWKARAAEIESKSIEE